MIKRLIFDVDNTLIPWLDEYNRAIDETLEELKYPHNSKLCEMIDIASSNYEIDRRKYTRKGMLEFINKEINQELPSEFIDIWINNLKKCAPATLSEEEYMTLETLSKKYELVILTNWFEESQITRLKKSNIYKYFSEIYGAEKFAKPYKESFAQAIGNNLPEECAMIGDDLKNDIKGAIDAGITNVIWKNISNKKIHNKNILNKIKIIYKLEELLDIL